jgi:hypothetical protein
MMDLLKIKLSTKFMKGLVAKIISKRIYKQLGYKIDIQLNDVQIDVIDGDVQIHLDVDGKMNKTEFSRIMERIDEES